MKTAINNTNIVKDVMNNLQERYEDLKKVDEIELLKDVYVTIPFSFSSEFCTLFLDKNEEYIDDLINGVCLNGVNHKFDEQNFYMEYVMELTQTIIRLVKEM